MFRRTTIVLITGLLLSTACAKSGDAQQASSTSEPAGLPDRDPKLAKKLVSEGAVLLDVRSQGEWDEGHIEGATLIPVDELPKRLEEVDKLTGGDKNKPIVVYCRSGGRAGRAKKALQDAGHKQVTNMGGIGDWPED